MTTPLMRRVERLDNALQGQRVKELNAAAVGRLRGRAAELVELAAKMRESADELVALRAQGVDVKVNPVPKPLPASIDEASEAVAADPLAAGGDKEPPLLPMMRTHAQHLRDAVPQAWSAFKARTPPPVVSKDLLIALPDVNQRWVLAETSLFRIDSAARPGTGDVARRAQLIEELRQLARGVSEKLPQPVAEFVRAVATGGAPLSMLDDPVVRRWLDEDGRGDGYRIVGGRS